MRLVLTTEFRFFRTPDKRVWTTSAYPYEYWSRYLEVFDEVIVAARVQDISETHNNLTKTDGAAVAFKSLPYYIGPLQYAVKYKGIDKALKELFQPGDAVLCRVPSQLATRLVDRILPLSYPYALEVVGDPYDVFSHGSSLFRHVCRWWFVKKLKEQCLNACGAAYVTRQVLQERYHPGPSTHVSHYTSGGLSECFFDPLPEGKSFNGKRMISIGSLSQLYKGPEMALKALAICREKGFSLNYTWVGGGRYRERMISLAKQLGLSEVVSFPGEVPSGEEVCQWIDAADIFILPSFCEGLPRAMIEAMSRGLPCIGSRVGGMTELLSDQFLVPPGDPLALANVITQLVENPSVCREQSKRNKQKAKEYRESILIPRRTAFYSHLQDITASWNNQP